MKRYAITEKAGPMVAGRNNTGVGSVLTLAEKEAKYELKLGTLVDLEAQAKAPKKAAKKSAKKDGGENGDGEAAEGASSPAS